MVGWQSPVYCVRLENESGLRNHHRFKSCSYRQFNGRLVNGRLVNRYNIRFTSDSEWFNSIISYQFFIYNINYNI